MKKTYKSKVSTLLIAFIAIVFYLPLIIDLFYNRFNFIQSITITIIFLLIIYPLYHIYYVIDHDILIIKIWFILMTSIQIKQIKSIKPTNSILSAPASSFDRIQISYNKYDECIISPCKKKEFVEDLKSVHPGIISNVTAI